MFLVQCALDGGGGLSEEEWIENEKNTISDGKQPLFEGSFSDSDSNELDHLLNRVQLQDRLVSMYDLALCASVLDDLKFCVLFHIHCTLVFK